MDGVGESPFFDIGPNVFIAPLKVTMDGLYGQRCGVAVEVHSGDDVFKHGECHHGDASVVPRGGRRTPRREQGLARRGRLREVRQQRRLLARDDAAGVRAMAGPAQQGGARHPRSGRKRPDYLDECAFQLAWLFGMQLPDGSVADRITTQNFDAMISPEASSALRRLSPVSTVATADFVAVMAQAARIYKAYDEDPAARALDAALRAQAFLEATPNTIAFDTTGYTGGYTSADVDDRFWAHAELWVTTGEAKYLEAFETRAPTFHVRNNFDWPDLGNMAIFAYMLSIARARARPSSNST